MDKNSKISNIQLSALLITIIIGVGILSLPSAVAAELKTDGWILLITAGILVILVTLIISFLGNLYPGKTLVEFGRGLLTTPISDVISFIYWAYFVGLTAFEMRVFAEVVKMFLLTQTPTEVIIITMLLATSYIARCGIEELARMALLILPIVTITIFIIFIFLLPDLDFTNLLPVFRFKPLDLVKGLPTTFFSFIGFELLLLFMAYIDKPEDSPRHLSLSIVFITFIYVLTFIVTLGQFGVDDLQHQLWPTLTLMKAVDIPGAFIENIDAVVMTIWVLAVFTSLGPMLFGSALILSKLFRVKEHKYFVLPIIPITYFLSLVPDNLAQTYEYMDLFTFYLGTFATTIVPLLLFIVALFKRAGKKEAANNEKGK